MTLSLAQAIREDRLADFIEQEEARGVGPADEAAFDDLAESVIRTPPRDDQTSGSLPDGGSLGR